MKIGLLCRNSRETGQTVDQWMELEKKQAGLSSFGPACNMMPPYSFLPINASFLTPFLFPFLLW